MSKQLTQALTEEIKSEVQYLLGRAKQCLRCPIDPHDLETAWMASFKPEILQSFAQLEAAGYYTDNFKTYNPKLNVLVEGDIYMVVINQRLSDRPRASEDSPDHFHKCWPLGADKWDLFSEWVKDAGHIDYEFNTATITIEAVFGMCKTVGQLVRAMPDLAGFMPAEIREMLRNQKRASSMPYEWAAFSKQSIDAAQLALAKAHCLPDQGVRRKQWMHNNPTWASIQKPAKTVA